MRRGTALSCLILALSLAMAGRIEAQSAADLSESAARALSAMSELERSTLAYSIAVSTYAELSTLARKHGLPHEVDIDQLRKELYAFFNLSPPVPPALSSKMLVESASSVEYFDLDDKPGDAMVLKGPLRLTMATDDGVNHKVSAKEILFNRGENIVAATGNVVYSRIGKGREDEFRGEKILIDLDSYSGVFIDGSYDMAPTGTLQRSMTFAFQSLARRGSELSVLEDARVTACDESPPHYHIRAAKVWLFENGDWAVSNATLYVGVVPLLWLPFFYYPADEIIFHPAIGYASREGSYVQTTTYLIGERKALSADSSSLSLLESAPSGEKTYSGIFIQRKTAEKDQAAAAGEGEGQVGDSLKVLADFYSALGVHLGAEGSFSFSGKESLSFSAGLGISRSLFLQSNGYYSPFDAANSYASTWNPSNFLGVDLPFRFGFQAKYGSAGTMGPLRYSLSLEAPLFSDPYFEQDFRRRSESSSIISIFSSKAPTVAKRSTMTQSLLGSLSWTAPAGATQRFLGSASLSRFASQAVWNSKAQSNSGLTTQEKRLLSADPQREFFYPDSLKLADAALQLSGTLATVSVPGKDGDQGEKSFSATVGWSMSGSGTVEEKFRSSAWQKPEDVDASLSYLLLGYKGTAQVNAQASAWGNVATLKTSLGMALQDQERPYLFDDRTSPSTVHPYRLADWAYRSASSDLSNTVTIAPIQGNSPFASTNLSYTLGASLFKFRYAGLDGSGLTASPRYETLWADWSAQYIGSHSATASIGYAPKGGAVQQLSLSATLPPLTEKYSLGYSLTHRFVRASLQGALARPVGGDELSPSLLSASLGIGASPYPLAKVDFSWDFNASAPLSIGASMEYRSAKASFIAKKSKGYAFSSGLWSLDGTDYFRPYETSLSWSPSLGRGGEKEPPGGVEALRFSFKPTFSYVQNFVRYTESTLSLGLDLSLASADGTSLKFSSSTANRSAWRYWTGLFPESPGFNPDDYARSLFGDIADSLSIWDSGALRRTLFKLSSLSLELGQDLHDWSLKAGLAMNPVLISPDAGRPYYQLDFSFSLSVAWKDIPEIKTSFQYEEGEFQ